MAMRTVCALFVLAVLVMLAACSPGAVARRLAAPPSLAEVTKQTRCAVAPSQLRPLVVEWAAADRGSLEVQLGQGPVVVRYEGCELEVLPGCTVPGRYVYAGFTAKRDLLTIRSTDELYMHMPLGAERLAGRLARSGELQVQLDLVGQHLADRETFTRWDLAGRCTGATHVIQAAQVGAFSFAATTRTALGAGGERGSERELLNVDGDAAACTAARSTDAAAPAGCAALLRLEFTPLHASGGPTPGALELPPSRRARLQGYASADYRGARRWTAFGGILVGLSAAGAGMIVGGFTGQALARREADQLDPRAHDFQARADALHARGRSLAGVGVVGIGMAAVLPVFGGLALDYGLSMMRASRVQSGRRARVGVAPRLGRTFGGVAVTVRF
jgi:hypothetical protein